MFWFLSVFSEPFKLLTVNARGFTNSLTYNLLFDLIETSNCDVCFVQETLISLESTISPCLADGWAEVFGLRPLVDRGVSSL